MWPEFTEFSPKLIELSKSKVYCVGHSENWRLKEYVKRYFPRFYDNQNITTAYPPIGIHLQAILGKYLPPGFYTTGPTDLHFPVGSGIIIQPERVIELPLFWHAYPLVYYISSSCPIFPFIVHDFPPFPFHYLIVEPTKESERIKEEHTRQGRSYTYRSEGRTDREWIHSSERKELLFLNRFRAQSFALKYIFKREIRGQ